MYVYFLLYYLKYVSIDVCFLACSKSYDRKDKIKAQYWLLPDNQCIYVNVNLIVSNNRCGVLIILFI